MAGVIQNLERNPSMDSSQGSQLCVAFRVAARCMQLPYLIQHLRARFAGLFCASEAGLWSTRLPALCPMQVYDGSVQSFAVNAQGGEAAEVRGHFTDNMLAHFMIDAGGRCWMLWSCCKSPYTGLVHLKAAVLWSQSMTGHVSMHGHA